MRIKSDPLEMLENTAFYKNMILLSILFDTIFLYI